MMLSRKIVGWHLHPGVRSVVTSTHGAQQAAATHRKESPNAKRPSSVEELKNQLHIQFSHAKLGKFTQTPPYQENMFTNNAFLKSYLTSVLPPEVKSEIWNDLSRFGERAVTEIHRLGRECELNPPFVRTFDAWGNRIDELVTCEAWKRLKDISAEEGIIATAYEGKYGEFDRLYQMVKVYLFGPVSGMVSCPLAMTDGAAKVALATGSPVLKKPFKHLTSRDPKTFWTSGQWMTEKRGGSDVSGATETVAVEHPEGAYELFGYKWFSSATDSDMALTLANIISEEHPTPKPRGLTMFYLETKQADGKLNGMEIIKLKNKLGTRQLPTAELLLDGTVAHQVSDEGRGVSAIADMLTVTRLHNSAWACSNMRRMLMLARDYSIRRSAFGSIVGDHPLHQLTAARMEGIVRGCEALTFHCAHLLGREEAGVASKQESLVLRILTPVMKMYTAKCSMSISSEGLECFGGQGYIEDTGLPQILRDSQVLPIWEGTSNIMSLDVLRSILKTNGAVLAALYQDVVDRMETIKGDEECSSLVPWCQGVIVAAEELRYFLARNQDAVHTAARDITTSIANIYIGGLLLEAAQQNKSRVSQAVAVRWCQKPLMCLKPDQYSQDNAAIAMEGYDIEQIHGPMF